MSAANTSPPQLAPAPSRRWGQMASLRHAGFATAAMIGYLLSVVAANIASVRCQPVVVGGLIVPAGTVFAGASFTARDLVQDALGAPGVVVGILAGAGLSAVFASPQIAVASVAAFTASEIADALIYTRMRHRSRLRAIAVSNACGLVVDSVLFVPLAFGSFTAVPGQLVGKAVTTLLTLASLQIMSAIVRRTVMRP